MNRTKRFLVTGALSAVIAALGFRASGTVDGRAVIPQHKSKRRLARRHRERSARGGKRAELRATHIETVKLQQAAGLERRTRQEDLQLRGVDTRDHDSLRTLVAEWKAREERRQRLFGGDE